MIEAFIEGLEKAGPLEATLATLLAFIIMVTIDEQIEDIKRDRKKEK